MQIFDRAILRRRRDRAAARFAEHDFLFREVADRLVDRLDDLSRKFETALTLGDHDGVLARHLTERPELKTVVTADLSPTLIRQAPGHRIAADEEAIPIADESVDLVASVLSLHWVNDLPGALIQIRRALKPDGLFLAAMFGGGTLETVREAFLQAEATVEGGASPHVSPFADVQDMGGLLQRAGFALPVIDTDEITVTWGDPFALMRDLRGMGESNAVLARRRQPMRRETLMAAAAALQQTANDQGRIPATFRVLYLAAWAPDASQQQPLNPGSAAARLADALESKETAAGEKAVPNRSKDRG